MEKIHPKEYYKGKLFNYKGGGGIFTMHKIIGSFIIVSGIVVALRVYMNKETEEIRRLVEMENMEEGIPCESYKKYLK